MKLSRTTRLAILGLALTCTGVTPATAGPTCARKHTLLRQLAFSGPGLRHPSFMRELFPPRLVMQHQAALGLSDAQRNAITKAIAGRQTEIVDLQWKIEQASQRLATLLREPRVDEAAALTAIEDVLKIENAMKKAHFGLLLQIKNELSAKQQETLRGLRRERPGRGHEEPM